MGITRRELLTRIGQVGGYSAAFATMQSLGLLALKGEQLEPIKATAGVGKGVRVVVLGGGIGGLVTAYEMKKLGYDVTILEARERPGGRNWTGRNGTKVEFVDGTVQTINWKEGNYQNLGPARLPSTHWTMLEYAHELGVRLEVEVNTSRSALLQNDNVNGGKAIPQRKAINDTRGIVAELLNKCVATGALDAQVSNIDRERMKDFLTKYGSLDAGGTYKGSARAGYKSAPGAGRQGGEIEAPLDLQTLLDGNFWDEMLIEETWDWQATMMQPVGGMDRIPYAFAKSLGNVIQYNSPVTAIRKTAKGVSIFYKQGGSDKQLEADYCVIALPFEILKKIPNDLSPQCKQAIDGSTPFGFYKIAWESRRFWERDYNIYGGISYLTQTPYKLWALSAVPSVVWYPSTELMRPDGILVSGYGEEQGTGFGDLSMEQKFSASQEAVERLHPGHSKELTNPIFCGWRRVKWNEGSWVRSYGNGLDGYNTLIEADGPIYFAGDSVSKIPGWQEGAALSARRAVDMISQRVRSRTV
jgi:monoamine oxidase